MDVVSALFINWVYRKTFFEALCSCHVIFVSVSKILENEANEPFSSQLPGVLRTKFSEKLPVNLAKKSFGMQMSRGTNGSRWAFKQRINGAMAATACLMFLNHFCEIKGHFRAKYVFLNQFCEIKEHFQAKSVFLIQFCEIKDHFHSKSVF